MRQLKIGNIITPRSEGRMDQYLRDISHLPILQVEEEVELAQRIHKGNQEAFEKLVCCNLRFVVSVAKQYQNQGITLIDLINEGNIGLIKAAQKFDETRGFKFISYAVWWIRQSILQSISEFSHPVRLPLNQIGVQNKVKNAIDNFVQEFERRPSVEEIAEITDMDIYKVQDALDSISKKVSVDAPFSQDEPNSMIDLMTDESARTTDYQMDKESLSADLESALSILNARERQVIKMLFGIGCKEMTAEEVATLLNLTRERVRQIKERALRRLRESDNIRILMKYLG